MKIEVVITIWDEGVFKSRDRIEASSFGELEPQIRHILEDREDMVANKNYPLPAEEDDDIPF